MTVKNELQSDEIPDGVTFMRKLITEQSVFIFPTDYFELPGFLRIVLTAPEEQLKEACQRIKEFCEKYYKV